MTAEPDLFPPDLGERETPNQRRAPVLQIAPAPARSKGPEPCVVEPGKNALFDAALAADANGRPIAVGAVVYRLKQGPESAHGIVRHIHAPRCRVLWPDCGDGRPYETHPLIHRLVQL